MPLDVEALSRLKVKDLQRELKKRGLDTSGLKAVLLGRLEAHLEKEKTLETPKEEKQETTEVCDNHLKSREKEEEDEELQTQEEQEKARDDEKETTVGQKRAVEALGNQDETGNEVKRTKGSEKTAWRSPQPEDEDGGKLVLSGDDAEADDKDEEDTGTNDEHMSTVRIDNFVRPFTLNAVKELVQEFGLFVEEGFWMDAIKTHCFVTYSSSEIAEKARSALDGKVWPPENGRSLSVKLVNCTAMEVSQHGEASVPSRSRSKSSSGAQATQRPKVTIDEFFLKTETKPVLYYLPLTDEQIKQKKERPAQQPEGQPRKRRHRGGRKRNRRARFQRR